MSCVGYGETIAIAQKPFNGLRNGIIPDVLNHSPTMPKISTSPSARRQGRWPTSSVALFFFCAVVSDKWSFRCAVRLCCASEVYLPENFRNIACLYGDCLRVSGRGLKVGLLAVSCHNHSHHKLDSRLLIQFIDSFATVHRAVLQSVWCIVARGAEYSTQVPLLCI